MEKVGGAARNGDASCQKWRNVISKQDSPGQSFLGPRWVAQVQAQVRIALQLQAVTLKCAGLGGYVELH